MKHKLITPVPNLNGNSKDSLILHCVVIKSYVDELLKVMHNASDLWHGRNFQTYGNASELREEAQEGWAERISWLYALERELTDLALKIQNGEKEKEL